MNLEGHNFDQYERLLVSIEANASRLNLLIAVCNDSQFRDEVIEQYETEVEEGIYCYRIALQPERPSIRFLLEELIEKNPQIKEQDRVVVTVLGTDRLRFLEVKQGEKSEVEEFAGFMQWTREGLRRFPFSIVIWVTTNVENVLKQNAPDFWSWRKGVFRFESKPREFVRKTDLEPFREILGRSFEVETVSLIPLDDLQDLIQSIKAKDPQDSRLPSLYDALGNSYRQRLEKGEYRDYQEEAALGIDCFKKALSFPQIEPTDEAYRLNELGGLYLLLGNYTEAEPLYRRSLSIDEKVYGSDHPEVATDLNNLALLYDNQGKYAEAEELYQRSLSILEKVLGAEHPFIASSLNNLALLYDNQGKYEAAEPLFRRSLSIREKQLGSDHPDVAISLNNLAALYDTQGKYEEAEPLFRRSLSIMEKAFGADHPSVATSLNNLAGLYDSQGQYTEAEPLYRRSLSIWEKVLGADHPNVATSLNNLAWLYRNQEQYAKALPLYERAFEIRAKVLGENHPNTKEVKVSIEIVRQKILGQ